MSAFEMYCVWSDRRPWAESHYYMKGLRSHWAELCVCVGYALSSPSHKLTASSYIILRGAGKRRTRLQLLLRDTAEGPPVLGSILLAVFSPNSHRCPIYAEAISNLSQESRKTLLLHLRTLLSKKSAFWVLKIWSNNLDSHQCPIHTYGTVGCFSCSPGE